VARIGIVQDFLTNHFSPFISVATKGMHNSLFLNLPGSNKIDLSELLKTGWFKTLGSAYYSVGAIGALLEAEDEFKAGDRLGAGLTGGVAFGAILNAGKPVIGSAVRWFTGDAAFATAVGETAAAAGSGIGMVATAGILVHEGMEADRAAQELQKDNARFLQQCFGLSPELAYGLSAPYNHILGSRGSGFQDSAALQAYARAYRIPLAELLQKLNNQPIDKATEFVNVAANMWRDPHTGKYPESAQSDNPKAVGTYEVTMREGKGAPYHETWPYQAGSLRQLDYWADYLFGKNHLH
jgi:hypothetical protein